MASTGSVAFGTVAVGQRSSISITLTNQGSVPVKISQLNVTGPPFSANSQTALPVTIGASSNFTLTVQFSPTATGSTSGQLNISSDASTGSAISVALNGTGAPVLSSVSCTNGSMVGAGSDSCSITLNAAADTGGLPVSLVSNNAAVAVPASVTIPAGATTASFAASVSPVTSSQTAAITASVGGVAQTFQLNLEASVVALSLSTSSLAFGNVPVNSPATQQVILSSTGTVPVTVSDAALSGQGFALSGASLPLTIAPGQTAALTVQFDPTASGAAAGQLMLTSNSISGPSSTVSLSGTGLPVLTGLTCSSGSMTGAGTDSCTVTLNAAAATGGFAVGLASNNSAVTVPASVTVAAGATSASFSATVSSVSTATTVTLTASANSVAKTFALQLSAAGVPTLSINATTVAFGNVNVNTPTTQSVTLSSTGTAAVTVNSAVVAGSGFSVSGASFPLTLNPNQTATLSVQFDPTAAGAVTGTLTITSTSSTNPTAVVSLSGTGVANSYEVDLTWDAPSSSPDPVAGYNVYRAPSGSTSYAQVNSSVVTQTAFADTTVQNGQTYNYMVESVDANGIESVPSNTANIAVP